MRRRARGATLVEVMVVAGLIAVLAGLIWQASPLIDRLALRAAAVTLVGDLRSAQARAVAEHRADTGYGLRFAVGSSQYTVVTRRAGTETLQRATSLGPRVRVAYARFGGTDPAVVFFTGVSLFGAPSGGGTVTLAAGSARLCVRIAPATGRPRITGAGCP